MGAFHKPYIENLRIELNQTITSKVAIRTHEKGNIIVNLLLISFIIAVTHAGIFFLLLQSIPLARNSKVSGLNRKTPKLKKDPKLR